MKILDIDMDYFLKKAPSGISSKTKSRCDSKEYFPWKEDEVISFIENNLGLSKSNKIPGKVVTHHHEALYFWRDLIKSSKLSVPFEVVHVDSHADLGLGCGSWVFIFEKLLGLQADMRSNIEDYENKFTKYKKPDIGDYLLFAIAFRWISKLTYVSNPNHDGDDYLPYILKDCIEPNDKIQLPYNNKYPATYINDDDNVKEYLENSILEPVVDFNIIRNIKDVKYDGDFDFITFSISPNYTPKEADFIINIIKEYIK